MPNVEYKTNVFSILNRSGRPLAARRIIRQHMRSQFYIRFAIKAIDFMTKRTQEGKDVFGNPFEGYSQSYKNSLAYKIYNKTGKVNLTLTGEMLASLAIGSTFDGEIKIVILGEHNQAKAQGHTFGIERRVGEAKKVKIGNRTKTIYAKQKVRRRFVGLSDKEETEVFEETLREEIDERNLVLAVEGGLRVVE